MQLQDNLYVSKRLGVGAEPSQRLPFNVSVTLNGSALTNATGGDKVISQNTATIVGDFTNDIKWGLSSASFVFGANDFVQTGSADGDAKGIRNIYGRLSEVHVYAPNLPMDSVVGFQAEIHLEAGATGTTVTNAYGILVKDGRDVPGGIANRYGVKIESPTTGTNKWALYTSGTAPSSFGGNVTLNDTSGSSGLMMARSLTLTNSKVKTAGQARLTIYQASTGDIGAVIAAFPFGGNTLDLMRFQDVSQLNHFAIDYRGLPKWSNSNDSQTTVGAAGTAATLPSAPKKYIKIVDSDGSLLVIPAYAQA
ncbi:hypothetical protein ACX801_23390 [Arthrobacter bambusae]